MIYLFILSGLFMIYLFILLILGFYSHGNYSPIARKVDFFVTREVDTIEKITLQISNFYWLIRCSFVKRWWQNRKRFGHKSYYGMSWEGKEKEYMQRYASSSR